MTVFLILTMSLRARLCIGKEIGLLNIIQEPGKMQDVLGHDAIQTPTSLMIFRCFLAGETVYVIVHGYWL